MKFFIFFTLIVAVTMCTVASSPIKKEGRGVLINRPTKEEIFNSRIRRSDHELHVKGVKGRTPLLQKSPALSLRKGEYICGNRVCSLKPGEKPQACRDCQYPITLYTT